MGVTEARNPPKVVEQVRLLYWVLSKEMIVDDLNNYAWTIKMVFDQLADLYGDEVSPEQVKQRIIALLDADTAAEIIETARRVEEDCRVGGSVPSPHC